MIRLVPLRPAGPEPVDCETCLDLKRVSRIRGGRSWAEDCPDCGDEPDPEWNAWHELWDDARQGR